jgi:hypothetical protein
MVHVQITSALRCDIPTDCYCYGRIIGVRGVYGRQGIPPLQVYGFKIQEGVTCGLSSTCLRVAFHDW